MKYFALLSLLFSCSLFGQTTLTLTPAKDAAIGFHDGTNGANTNYGTAAQNAAYWIPGTAGPVNGNRALIAFDLTQVPAGASVISAKLNLYAYGPIGSYPGHTGPDNRAYLQRVTQVWQESVVTWNTQPTSTSVNEVMLAATTNPTQDYLNIDVTQLVNDMIANPSGSDGFLLKLVNEATTNILAFCSKDNSNASKKPVLEIVYNRACQDSINEIADYDAAIGFHDGTNGANTNYGTAVQSAAYWIPGVSGPVNANRALTHFDLSGIPVGATITGAYLDFYAYGPIGSYPGHVGANSSYLQRVMQTWQDNVVTWNNQPSATSVNQVTLPASTSSTQDYLNIDVTALISDIYLSGTNNGLLLKLVNEQVTNILAFCSKDHPDVTKHPRLRVYYTTCAVNVVHESLKNNFSFTVFPNPAGDHVEIMIGSSQQTGPVEVMIADQLGQVVLKSTMPYMEQQKLSLSLGALPPGIYFVQVSTATGRGTARFVKE